MNNSTRPSVQINRANQCDVLLSHLKTHLEMFTSLPGLIGVTLNGGLSRGYGDHLSEIDVTLYLESETYAEWQRGYAPIGLGIQRIEGELYDIKSVDFAQENVAQWSSDARWDASYAQVLHDPTGVIGALLEQNDAFRPQPWDASGPLFGAWWHFKLAGDIWIHRDDPLQAQYMLNQAVGELLKALFIANGEFIPHGKWLVHMSRTLKWTPDNWLERLTHIMCQLAPNTENVKTRQQTISALWDEIDRYIITITGEDYSLNVAHRTFYNLMRMLVDHSTVSVTQWQEVADVSLLNHAPFNLCVSRQGDSITLDRARCTALTPDDLYSWHYAIVEAVRSRL